MKRNLGQIALNIFWLVLTCSLTTPVFGANKYEYVNLTSNLVSKKTMVLAGFPKNRREQRKDYSFKNIEGQDLSYMDFLDANLQAAYMMGCNLTGSRLIGANCQDTFLRGADFRGADLTKANFSYADLRGADMSNAKLSSVNFSHAHFDQKTKFPEKITQCNFSHSKTDSMIFVPSGQENEVPSFVLSNQVKEVHSKDNSDPSNANSGYPLGSISRAAEGIYQILMGSEASESGSSLPSPKSLKSSFKIRNSSSRANRDRSPRKRPDITTIFSPPRGEEDSRP